MKNNKFKKQKYIVIKNAINKELAIFLYNYILLKREVSKIYFERKFIPPNADEWGVWNDTMVPNTYSSYGDVAMDTLLLKVQDIMEKTVEVKLIPTYSYVRIYKKGDILNRHVDRNSCEISTTLNLGGDLWPIYLEPSGQKNKKGVRINLSQGDMLVYRGKELEHWREPFEENDCAQVFLHYKDINEKDSIKYLYDGRPSLGTSSELK
jgi:hypothetical protein